MQSIEDISQQLNHRFQIKAVPLPELIDISEVKSQLQAATSAQSINLSVKIRNDYSYNIFQSREPELKEKIGEEERKNAEKKEELGRMQKEIAELQGLIQKAEDLNNFLNIYYL